MRKPSHPIYVSKVKEHSFARYGIRTIKDLCLHDDTENYMARNPADLNGLVNMLLDGRFFHARYTDPEYPM
jgi:hypothetical protein